MVGRLVKRQHIVWLEHKLCHSKPCALAAWQDTYLLVDVLTTKQELSQNVTKLVPYISDRYVVKGLPHGKITVKDVLLILSVIPDRNIVASLGLTADRLQLPHYHTHKGSLTLTVASDQGDLLSPSDLYLSVPEDDLLRIADCQILAFEDYVSGTRSRRELNRQRDVVSLVNLHSVKFFELLDAGLYLIWLRRLVAETVDEILRLLDHLLLVLIGRHLLREPFLA